MSMRLTHAARLRGRQATILGATLLLLPAPQIAQADGSSERVLALGGSVTEIVFALGEGDRLIGRDTTSSYPAAAADLPDVGYVRALSPEGVLSVDPDLIIAEAGAGPAETIDLLQGVAIPYVELTDARTGEDILANIATVADAIGAEQAGETLIADVGQSLAAVADTAQAIPEAERKRVLFILSLQGGRIMAAGNDTAADSMIALAGGVNAVDGFAGYKPLTDEAVSEADPDVIVMMDRDGDHSADDDTLFALPALSTTPAAESRSVVRMDGLYLLGFGPRTGAAALDLHDALYGPGR